MKKLLLVLMLFSVLQSFSQKKIYYKDIVNDCISVASNDAAVLDDIVYNCIRDKYISNYDFTSIDGKTISTNQIKKPIMLFAASSRYAPFRGEIPAINKIVEKYNDKVEFIMLFWDDAAAVKKVSDKLDKRITLVPSTEKMEDRSSLNISGFIHKLDYPSAYLISSNKRILDFKRGALAPTKKMGWDEVNKINEEKLEAFIQPILK